MDQRTYELISQFISERTGVRIEFILDDAVPHADVANKVIYLPANIKDENVFAALAITMHEAGHIQHTLFDPKQLVGECRQRFGILNAIEDVRIDIKNFDLLPNIKEFYRQLMKKTVGQKSDKDWEQAPIQMKVLATLICNLEQFRGEMTTDKNIDRFIEDNRLMEQAFDLMKHLDWLEYAQKQSRLTDCKVYYREAKKIIDSIHKIIFGKQPQQPTGPQPQGRPDPNGGGTGKGKGKGKKADGDEEECQGSGEQEQEGDNKDEGGSDKDGEGKQGNPDKQDGDKDDEAEADDSQKPKNPKEEELGDTGVMELLRRRASEVFGQSRHTSRGRGSAILGQVALEETTKNGLRELLNEKCIHEISEGNILDTNNLTTFFTGDIGELFKEQKVIARKKSKIVLMLDASGSMSERMCFSKDYTRKDHVVVKNALAIKKILDEVCEMEGMNVVYETWAFSCSTWKCGMPLDNTNDGYFKQGYYGGGTDIVEGLKQAQKTLTDPEVEGERLLIFLTDGEVSELQIADMKKKIMYSNSNIKALIIGVGANINGFFVKQVIGNNNIIAEKHSNIVLMEAICQLLGG